MAAMHQDKFSVFSKKSNYVKLHEKRMDLYLKIVEKYITKDLAIETSLTVVDFGTADGGSILPTFKEISEDNELCREDNVTVKTHLADIYRDLLPVSSIDIAFSVAVVTWLTIPCEMKNTLYWDLADIGEKKMIKQQAQIDWQNYLTCRSVELKNGGYLITILLGDQDSEKFLQVAEETLWKIYRENIIFQDEFERICFGVYGRSESEIRKPFQEKVVKGLKLIDLSHEFTYFLKDLGMTCNTISKFYEAFMMTSIHRGLSPDRDEHRKNEICKIYFDWLQTAFKNLGKSFEKQGVSTYTVIVQKSEV